MVGASEKSILVWELPIRLFHWALAASVILNYFVLETGSKEHRYLGYFACALIVLRILWGIFADKPYSQLKNFWPTRASLTAYVKALLKNQPPRHLTHNPLAALMMITLCLLVFALGVSGFLMRTDYFWGEEWLEEVHEIFANLLMFLSLMHALAAIIESFRHKENLVFSMIHGKKRPLD